MEIRDDNALYEEEVKLYFKALTPVFSPYLEENGGNIILLQIENELGYLRGNNRHSSNIMTMWKDLGVKVEFYTEDPARYWKSQHL